MVEFLQSAFWLVVTMTILVGFHEFGHFWVARKVGVKVRTFSIGFGPKLASRFDRHGTEFQVAALPLGGYVKMVDTREGAVDSQDVSVAFDKQSVGKRMAVVAAGPIANILMTIALFWLIAMIGTPVFTPKVAAVPASMQSTGLQVNDVITKVNGAPVDDSESLNMSLLTLAIERQDAQLSVEGTDGSQRTVVLPYSSVPATASTPETLGTYRFLQAHEAAPAVIGSVLDTSAAAAFVRAGDRIVAINGQPVKFWHEIAQSLATIPVQQGTTVQLEIDRQGERLTRDVALVHNAEQNRWVLGVTLDPNAFQAKPDHIRRLNPLTALPAAFVQTWDATKLMGELVSKAVRGKLELNLTVAGPVTTARLSNAVAKSGLAQYLKLLALLSLSVAILNLLPIPVLDGGHLLYYLIELAKGSPVSEKVQAIGNAVGLALIFSLMGLAFFNDFVNNF